MMLDAIAALAKSLARKHTARWSKYEDALALLHAADDGGRSKEGEQARRVLANPRRVSTYRDHERESLETDRATIIRKLDKPLAQSLGMLVSLELIEHRLAEIARAEKQSSQDTWGDERLDFYREQRPFIDELWRLGVPHGYWSVLKPEEFTAIARYIKSKVVQRVADLPPLRTKPIDGERKHMFWDPYYIPHDPNA